MAKVKLELDTEKGVTINVYAKDKRVLESAYAMAVGLGRYNFSPELSEACMKAVEGLGNLIEMCKASTDSDEDDAEGVAADAKTEAAAPAPRRRTTTAPAPAATAEDSGTVEEEVAPESPEGESLEEFDDQLGELDADLNGDLTAQDEGEDEPSLEGEPGSDIDLESDIDLGNVGGEEPQVEAPATVAAPAKTAPAPVKQPAAATATKPAPAKAPTAPAPDKETPLQKRQRLMREAEEAKKKK